MDIPKTLVIGINMHGELNLDVNKNPIYAIVPENMYISTINSVAPGVPNISTLENYDMFAEHISEKIKTITDWDTIDIEHLTVEIRELLVELNEEQSRDIIKLAQQNYSKGNMTDKMKAAYAHHYNKSFQIKNYHGGMRIPDKIFLKFTDREIENIAPDGLEDSYYFNKIVLYNLEGEPDLFEFLEMVGHSVDRITISQMCDFLNSLGVVNLIIVDLSCSIFRGETELTEREIRYARRQMIGGKKIKTRKYKNKNKPRNSKKKRKTKRRI